MEPALNTQIHNARAARSGIFFYALAALSTVVLGWMLFTQPRGFKTPATAAALLILLACTCVLIRWVGNPIEASLDDAPTRKGRVWLIGLVVGIPLFGLPMLFRTRVLYALPVLAVLVLVALRRYITRREAGYALGLALVAAAAGLASGWIRDVPPLEWAVMQVALVFTGLLCGWKVFQRFGLAGQGVGRSRFVDAGAPVFPALAKALRGFGLGMLISLPWAITNVLLGGAQDTWVKAWWQPIVALQPGIAEEAWGRVLMVALLFLAFRLAARPRAAFTIALFLAAYWFAYLHTPMGLEGIISTLMLGTLYALPVAYLCLFRDLETAMGWHFFVDFVRFMAAFLVLQGG